MEQWAQVDLEYRRANHVQGTQAAFQAMALLPADTRRRSLPAPVAPLPAGRDSVRAGAAARRSRA